MKRYLESAKKHNIELRSVCTDCKTVKIYSEKISYSLDKEISFDSENLDLTSVDHFVGSIASSIIFSLINYDQKHNQIIEEIEGKFTFSLDNPLSYLSVKGYDEIAKISELHIVLYIITFSELEELESLYNEAIRQSVLYQTVKNSLNISCDLKLLL